MPADRANWGWLGIEPKGGRRPTVPPAVGPDPLLTEGWARAALRAEAELLAGMAPNTGRNTQLNTSAFNLGQIVAGGGLEESAVVDALIEACHLNGLWDEEPTRCRGTIASGLAAGYESPRYPKEHPEASVGDQEGEVAPEPTRTDWGALWADTSVMEWLCEPLVPAGRLVALYSPPKVGKSLLALELTVAISRGAHMLGAKCKRTPVLYLDYENTRADVKDRLISMGMEPADLDGVNHESFPTLPPLDTLAGGVALLAMAQECGAGLVVIDTVSRAISGDENDSLTWHALYRNTLVKLKAAGIAVLRLDHTGKDEARGMRGSSAKSTDVDLVWRLEELVKGNSFLLKCEAQRIRITEEYINVERRRDPLVHAVDMRSVADTKEAAILAACEQAGLPTSAGRDQIRRVMTAAGLTGSTAFVADLTKRRQGQSSLGD